MRIKLDVPLSIGEIASAVGFAVTDQIDSMKISHISLNSKAARSGDLFIALNGEKYKGSLFAEDAAARGAIVLSEMKDDRFLHTDDTKRALGDIAKLYKSRLDKLSRTVMITGSVGKSTTKSFCLRISEPTFKTHATQGNLNNEFGLPISVLSSPADTELLILEAGMNSRGEISRLSRIAEPDIGAITNVGRAHMGKLGSLRETAKAKLEITDGVRGDLILPSDEPLLTSSDARYVSVGKIGGDFSMIPLDADISGSRFAFYKNGKKTFEGKLRIPGVHLLTSLAFAISIAYTAGIPTEKIAEGVSCINEEDVRSKIIHFRDFSVYDDSYNASPESVLAALKTLSLFKDAPKSALLGDMLELGEFSADAHREIGYAAAKSGLSHLYIMGEFSEYVRSGAINGGMEKERIFVNEFSNMPEISARQIIQNHEKSEIILFKASHALDLPRVIDYIKIPEG